MFDVLRNLGILDKFNPFPSLKYYSNRGLPRQELEEAITDAVTLAYAEFDPERGSTFATYAGLRVRWEVCSRFASQAKCKPVSSLSQNKSGESEEFDLGVIAAPEIEADEEVLANISINKRLFLEELFERAFPDVLINGVRTPRWNRKRDVLFARYCEHLSWTAVAEKLGLNSVAAAQNHDKKAKRALIDYVKSAVGRRFVADRLGEHAVDVLEVFA